MVRQYLGFDGRRLAWFAGVVGATFLLVTGTYWSIYGMDTWSNKIQQGANLMMAAGPVTCQGQASMGIPASGQYVCPQHGAVGLPVFDAAGTPHCPVCNQAMCFNSVRAGLPRNSMALAAGG